MGLTAAVAKIFDLIFLVLFVYIILTWVPNVKWNEQPFISLKAFSDVFFAPFRKIIPPIGMIDISPIVAFLVLQLLRKAILILLINLGL